MFFSFLFTSITSPFLHVHVAVAKGNELNGVVTSVSLTVVLYGHTVHIVYVFSNLGTDDYRIFATLVHSMKGVGLLLEDVLADFTGHESAPHHSGLVAESVFVHDRVIVNRIVCTSEYDQNLRDTFLVRTNQSKLVVETAFDDTYHFVNVVEALVEIGGWRDLVSQSPFLVFRIAVPVAVDGEKPPVESGAALGAEHVVTRAVHNLVYTCRAFRARLGFASDKFHGNQIIFFTNMIGCFLLHQAFLAQVQITHSTLVLGKSHVTVTSLVRAVLDIFGLGMV